MGRYPECLPHTAPVRIPQRPVCIVRLAFSLLQLCELSCLGWMQLPVVQVRPLALKMAIQHREIQ